MIRLFGSMSYKKCLVFSGFAVWALLAAVSCGSPGVKPVEDKRSPRQVHYVKDLREQAEKGDADAQALLGFNYYKGNSVDRDYEQAHRWFLKAAEQGNSFARLGLGTMYSAGAGVLRDDAAAAYWYGEAAEEGHVGCQYRLGLMYHEGRGVEQCRIQAYKWLYLASERGVTKAGPLRDSLAEEMTPEDIVEAKRLAEEWMTLHPR